MLCEECQKNEATVSITVTVGSEVKTRRLCPECMKRMEQSLTKGDVQGFLSAILSMMGASSAEELTCGGCGLKYSEFEKTGRLGCAQCYQDFSERLDPLLQRIHGRNQHAGRRPNGAELPKEDENAILLAELRRKMEEAVANENFEDAAKYRDEIRSLSEQCAQSGND